MNIFHNCRLNFLIVIIHILGYVSNSLSEYRSCTKDEYCLPVPAELCDNKYCQPFDLEAVNEFEEFGLKAYTWTIGQKPYIAYCPLKFHFDRATKYDGPAGTPANMSLHSGPHCNVTTTYIRSFFGEPDPLTGKFKTLTIDQAGDKYEICYTYLEPEVAFVYRACRVDPPPSDGQACAAYYALETARGNCNKNKFLKYLAGVGIDYPQIAYDCL